VRHQRRRADAEHLRRREHDEHQIAAQSDRSDGVGAQSSDPIEVDEYVEGLKHHAHQHEAGGLEQMPGE
jgi:hypothetical protein